MLEFSPDWDSRVCYLVVFFCALVSARLQIYGRLDILKEKTIYAWGLYSTWLIYTVYLFIPVSLFWFLDRTGALHDTAVFGALLVGLAYPAILSGSTSIKPTDSLSGVFGWLNKTTDALVTKTLALVDLNGRIFERAIVRHLNTNDDAYKKVEALALEYTADPTAMKKELGENTNNAEARAGIIYDYATNSVKGLKPLSVILPKLGLTPLISSPYTFARRWAFLYATLVAAASVLFIALLFSPWGGKWYVVWRLCKPGVTEADLQRSRQNLRHYMNSPDADVRRKIEKDMVNALQNPNLDVKRADEILCLLLQFRGESSDKEFSQLARLLVDSLRVSSVDVRSRVNRAILLLASEARGGDDPSLKPLKDWQPLSTDSSIDLETRWRQWSTWWANWAAVPSTG